MVLTYLWIVFQIIAGILYANLCEWIMHKYVLHGLGKRKDSTLSYHWHSHHRLARTNNFKDIEYNKFWWNKNTSRRSEVLGLIGLVAIHFWLVFFMPIFYITCIAWAFLYYFVHKKSHKDIKWAKKWSMHHYDHHMGLDQNKNWAVTIPLWDYILGTRVKYVYNENGKAIKFKKRSAS